MECKNCQKEHDGTYGSGFFCSVECARGFSHKHFTLTDDQKQNISKALEKRWRDNDFKNIDWVLSGAKGSSGKYKKPENLLQVSSRTIGKIFLRLLKEEGFGCSRCGWKEGIGDLHHINGKKIENPDHHQNLSYLCPNCHRLVHQKKIDKNSLVSLEKQIGDKWKKYYFG
jgi:hypothetical protein